MFSQKKNKRFTYNSRFSENETTENARKLKSDLTSEWQSVRRTGTGKQKLSSLVVLLILLALISLAMYYLDVKLR